MDSPHLPQKQIWMMTQFLKLKIWKACNGKNLTILERNNPNNDWIENLWAQLL